MPKVVRKLCVCVRESQGINFLIFGGKPVVLLAQIPNNILLAWHSQVLNPAPGDVNSPGGHGSLIIGLDREHLYSIDLRLILLTPLFSPQFRFLWPHPFTIKICFSL